MWEQEPRSPSPQSRTQTRAAHAARVAMSMKKAKNGNMPDGLKACVLSMLMMATMCRLIPEITGKLPGFLSPSAGLKFADIPNGLGAISKVPAAGWAQIAAYMAFCEVSQDQSPGTAAAAGDFGFKVLTSSDPAEKEKKLCAEMASVDQDDAGFLFV